MNRLRLIYAHDGTSTYDRLFLDRFASEYETYLVAFGSPTEIPKGIRAIRLRDFGRPLQPRRLNNLRIIVGTFWRVLQLYRCLRSIRPDIVIGDYVTTYGLYSSICGFRPFVLFVFGSDVLVDPQRSLLHRWITIRVIRSADLILVDSEVQRRAVISLGGLPAKIVSFPWVDLSDIHHKKQDSTLRDRLGWSNKIVAASVRHLERQYAIDTLVRAIPIVLSRSPNVRFLVFGEGALTGELVKLARELRIETFVHFAGFVPRSRLLQYVRSCDLYVSTSPSDGTSSSLLEAMFLGVPAVVTRIPGNAEWVSDRLNGLLFDKYDHYGLARAIVLLASNCAEARRLARRAKKDVRRRVNWEVAFNELVSRMNRAYAEHDWTQQMETTLDSLRTGDHTGFRND